MTNLEEFTQAYLVTALWSSNDESDESGGQPLDLNRDEDDIASDSRERMEKDCEKFFRANHDAMASAIETGKVKYGPDFGPYGRAGHDFWLTRNGHGAGFWDGDWPEPFAAELTNAAKQAGGCDLYLGDDKQIHIM